MSTLIENVAKVEAANAALKEAIAAKGVAVPEGTKLSEMPALVGQIETPPVPTNARAVFTYDETTSIVVPNTLVVDMTNMTSLIYCFYNCYSITSLTLPAGFGQYATDVTSCFRNCYELTSLDLPAGFGQNATRLFACFGNCRKLTSLTLPAGFGQNSTENGNCFGGCSELTYITGNPNFKVSISLSPCTKLTHDSLMVVINGLQTVTTAQKLTLGTTNLARLTDEEKKVATDKGWTLA